MSGERVLIVGDPPPFVFRYTNYKGETEMRRVKPEAVWYGSTSYHPDHQWFLSAWDLDRKANRNFAMKDIETKPL